MFVKTPQILLVFTWNLRSCFWVTWCSHIQSWLVQRHMQTEGALMKLTDVFISPPTTTPPPAHRYLSHPVGLIHICLAAVFITGTATQQTDNYPFCLLSVKCNDSREDGTKVKSHWNNFGTICGKHWLIRIMFVHWLLPSSDLNFLQTLGCFLQWDVCSAAGLNLCTRIVWTQLGAAAAALTLFVQQPQTSAAPGRLHHPHIFSVVRVKRMHDRKTALYFYLSIPRFPFHLRWFPCWFVVCCTKTGLTK